MRKGVGRRLKVGEMEGAETGAGPLATPSPAVRARGSQSGSHTNRLREQS